MKLSEAIRLGALLKPQARRTLERDGRTCVIGAARNAIGIPNNYCIPNPEAWNEILALGVCPVCGKNGKQAESYIAAHLNDVHRWTREAIAEWVEQIEAQHAPQPEVGQQNLTEALR